MCSISSGCRFPPSRSPAVSWSGVVVRLSAFILLCIGVHIGWNGLRALLVGAFLNAAS
jgi:hypothetical protein